MENNTNELALLPNKFKKLIWIKKGDFVIVSSSLSEEESAVSLAKVKYLIKCILNKDQIKHLKQKSKWPEYLASNDSAPVISDKNNSYEGYHINIYFLNILITVIL